MRRLVVVVVPLLCLGLATASRAEEVVELGRTRGGAFYDSWQTRPAYNVDPTDDSVWLIEGAAVVRLSPDGGLLARSPALRSPYLLAVDTANGSCWVLEGMSDDLVHLSANATVLSTTTGQSGQWGAHELIPSPADSSVWVAQFEAVTHVNSEGEEIGRRPYAHGAWRLVAVDPLDGAAWIASGQSVARVRPDASSIWEVTLSLTVRTIDEDRRDNSLWVGTRSADGYAGELVHISPDGSVILHQDTELPVVSVTVCPLEGSVWVEQGGDPAVSYIAHLDSSGRELWRSPRELAVHNDLDGSVWLRSGSQLYHYSADHRALESFDSEYSSSLRAFIPTDNSFWTSDWNALWLRHVAADGAVLQEQRWLELALPGRSALDHRDGSCWAINWRDWDSLRWVAPELYHVLSDGTICERRELTELSASSLYVSPVDGSSWLTGYVSEGESQTAYRAHLAEDGTEIGRAPLLGQIGAINEDDGTLWASIGSHGYSERLIHVPGYGYLYHLAPDGTELWHAEFGDWIGLPRLAPGGSVWVEAETPAQLVQFSPTGEQIAEIPLADELGDLRDFAVLPSDGSIYGVSDITPPEQPADINGRVFRMAPDGAILWGRDILAYPGGIVVDPVNGSAWVTDGGTWSNSRSEYYYLGSALVHLASDGTELWRGGKFNLPGWTALDPEDGSIWVTDLLDGQLVHLAAYGFRDVLGNHWAYRETSTCARNNIVVGYPDGLYHPEFSVTRDQMAVYVARALVRPSGDAGIADPGPPPTFTDVLPEFWAYKQIEYVVSQNVVEGYEDGTYQPSLLVDRGQMAVYIARAMVAPTGDAAVADPEPPYTFPDVPGDDNTWAWCHKHVEFLAGRGVVTGYLDGLYHPENAVTRDQMAVYIARAFDLL
jgi:hypothetical protein